MLFDVNGLVLLALNQGCDVVIVFRSTFPFIMDCGLIDEWFENFNRLEM